MPHHLSHRKTLPHAEFQTVVSGISEASKCFPTIELLDAICQICLMNFTSSSRATSKMPLDLVEEETLYGSTTEVCHGLGEMSAPNTGILDLCGMGSGLFPFLQLLFL